MSVAFPGALGSLGAQQGGLGASSTYTSNNNSKPHASPMVAASLFSNANASSSGHAKAPGSSFPAMAPLNPSAPQFQQPGLDELSRRLNVLFHSRRETEDAITANVASITAEAQVLHSQREAQASLVSKLDAERQQTRSAHQQISELKQSLSDKDAQLATAEQALRDLRVEKEGLAQALAEAQQQHKTTKEAAEVADSRAQALEAELAEERKRVQEASQSAQEDAHMLRMQMEYWHSMHNRLVASLQQHQQHAPLHHPSVLQQQQHHQHHQQQQQQQQAVKGAPPGFNSLQHPGVSIPPSGPQPNGIGLPHFLQQRHQHRQQQQQQQLQSHGYGGKVHPMDRLMREDELLAMFAKILPHSPQQALIISQELEMDVEERFLLRSWDGSYSGSYGSMQDFLAAHDDVFGCTEQSGFYVHTPPLLPMDNAILPTAAAPASPTAAAAVREIGASSADSVLPMGPLRTSWGMGQGPSRGMLGSDARAPGSPLPASSHRNNNHNHHAPSSFNSNNAFSTSAQNPPPHDPTSTSPAFPVSAAAKPPLHLGHANDLPYTTTASPHPQHTTPGGPHPSHGVLPGAGAAPAAAPGTPPGASVGGVPARVSVSGAPPGVGGAATAPGVDVPGVAAAPARTPSSASPSTAPPQPHFPGNAASPPLFAPAESRSSGPQAAAAAAAAAGAGGGGFAPPPHLGPPGFGHVPPAAAGAPRPAGFPPMPPAAWGMPPSPPHWGMPPPQGLMHTPMPPPLDGSLYPSYPPSMPPPPHFPPPVVAPIAPPAGAVPPAAAGAPPPMLPLQQAQAQLPPPHVVVTPPPPPVTATSTPAAHAAPLGKRPSGTAPQTASGPTPPGQKQGLGQQQHHHQSQQNQQQQHSQPQAHGPGGGGGRRGSSGTGQQQHQARSQHAQQQQAQHAHHASSNNGAAVGGGVSGIGGKAHPQDGAMAQRDGGAGKPQQVQQVQQQVATPRTGAAAQAPKLAPNAFAAHMGTSLSPGPGSSSSAANASKGGSRGGGSGARRGRGK